MDPPRCRATGQRIYDRISYRSLQSAKLAVQRELRTGSPTEKWTATETRRARPNPLTTARNQEKERSRQTKEDQDRKRQEKSIGRLQQDKKEEEYRCHTNESLERCHEVLERTSQDLKCPIVQRSFD